MKLEMALGAVVHLQSYVKVDKSKRNDALHRELHGRTACNGSVNETYSEPLGGTGASAMTVTMLSTMLSYSLPSSSFCASCMPQRLFGLPTLPKSQAFLRRNVQGCNHP